MRASQRAFADSVAEGYAPAVGPLYVATGCVENHGESRHSAVQHPPAVQELLWAIC